MSELLPCPFCLDGKVKDYIGEREAGVVCSCGASVLFSYDGAYVSEDEALCEGIKLWNTRHYPAEVQQAVERMKPKKPDNSGKFKRTCFCGKTVYIDVNKFCSDCGQALDWSE